MSTDVIIRDNTAIVTTEVDYYVPINYGAQGPEGALGPQGLQGLQGIQGIQGPAGTVEGSVNLSMLADVSLTDIVDGALLMYNGEQGKWTPSTLLNKQTLECGQY